MLVLDRSVQLRQSLLNATDMDALLLLDRSTVPSQQGEENTSDSAADAAQPAVYAGKSSRAPRQQRGSRAKLKEVANVK